MGYKELSFVLASLVLKCKLTFDVDVFRVFSMRIVRCVTTLFQQCDGCDIVWSLH